MDPFKLIGTLAPIILLAMIPSCQQTIRPLRSKLSISPDHTHIETTQAPTNPPITIFIHGTRFFRCKLYHSFFNSTPGLKLASSVPKKNYLYNSCRAISNADPYLFPFETFYVFGWSGKLSALEREKAANILYKQLIALKKEYKKKYGANPEIQIIGHSHGGNVALNLARERLHIHKSLTISRLILLACPVQANTMHHTHHPMFKKIYSLYSSLDMVQVMAPQIVRDFAMQIQKIDTSHMKIPPFSSRRFPAHSKITQVKTKMNGHAVMHSDFTMPPFLSTLPTVLGHLDTWHSNPNDYERQAGREKWLSIYTNCPHDSCC